MLFNVVFGLRQVAECTLDYAKGVCLADAACKGIYNGGTNYKRCNTNARSFASNKKVAPPPLPLAGGGARRSPQILTRTSCHRGAIRPTSGAIPS
jgi:hypothetical protein